jgi:hypothetical protein
MAKRLAEMLSRLFRSSRRGAGVVYVTEQDLDRELEVVAHELGVSAADAMRKLDAGELDGTSAELRLRMLRYLRHPEQEIPARAAA